MQIVSRTAILKSNENIVMWQNCNDLLIEWYSFVSTAACKQCSRGIPRQWPYSVLMTYGYKNTFTVIESQLRRITVYHFGEKDISFHHNENGYIVGLKRTPNSTKKSKQQSFKHLDYPTISFTCFPCYLVTHNCRIATRKRTQYWRKKGGLE